MLGFAHPDCSTTPAWWHGKYNGIQSYCLLPYLYATQEIIITCWISRYDGPAWARLLHSIVSVTADFRASITPTVSCRLSTEGQIFHSLVVRLRDNESRQSSLTRQWFRGAEEPCCVHQTSLAPTGSILQCRSWPRSCVPSQTQPGLHCVVSAGAGQGKTSVQGSMGCRIHARRNCMLRAAGDIFNKQDYRVAMLLFFFFKFYAQLGSLSVFSSDHF